MRKNASKNLKDNIFKIKKMELLKYEPAIFKRRYKLITETGQEFRTTIFDENFRKFEDNIIETRTFEISEEDSYDLKVGTYPVNRGTEIKEVKYCYYEVWLSKFNNKKVFFDLDKEQKQDLKNKISDDKIESVNTYETIKVTNFKDMVADTLENGLYGEKTIDKK